MDVSIRESILFSSSIIIRLPGKEDETASRLDPLASHSPGNGLKKGVWLATSKGGTFFFGFVIDVELCIQDSLAGVTKVSRLSSASIVSGS